MNSWLSILFINVLISAGKSCLPPDNQGDSADNLLFKIHRNESNYIIIDNLNNCLGKDSKFICYHNGKCISKYSNVNSTHILKSYYCVCDYVSDINVIYVNI
jgi:hypothetical protein